PILWNNGTRALGSLGDPASVAALRRERALASGDARDDHRRRLMCDVGLAVAGDADAWASVLTALDQPEYDWVGVQAALGWDARRVGGDPKAVPAMIELWGRPAARTTRLELAMCALAGEPEPDGLPADEWAAAMSESRVRTGRVIAHAWALRRGRPEARAALLTEMREILAVRDVVARTEGPEEDEGSAVVEALRALVRWGS
ncbi:MAG TPA: hypothetical protein VND21_08390, partial [Planctomycetota bacterium]|nr:hypothetical protein [Planctomycetota bacterium]